MRCEEQADGTIAALFVLSVPCHARPWGGMGHRLGIGRSGTERARSDPTLVCDSLMIIGSANYRSVQ